MSDTGQRKFLCGVFVFGLLLAGTISAAADERAVVFQDGLSLNGKSFYESLFFGVFVETAISRTIASIQPPPLEKQTAGPIPAGRWQAEQFVHEQPWDVLYAENKFYKKYPWLAEYLYRQKGVPDYAVINKWIKPIRISFGYPNNLKLYALPDVPAALLKSYKNYQRFPVPPLGAFLTDRNVEAESWHIQFYRESPGAAKIIRSTYEAAEKEVMRHTGLLSDLAKLPVTYVTQEKDDKESPAEIRIILVKSSQSETCGKDNWKTMFKHRVPPDSFNRDFVRVCTSVEGDPLAIYTHSFRDDFEQYLTTRVVFTAGSEHQVDGYLLPAADNSIGMAFCFINAFHPPEIVQALVRECLVRAMGLPESSDTRSPHYNHGITSLWNDPLTKSQRENRSLYKAPPEITELDQHLLRTLYHPAIKPGMTALELRQLRD